MQDLPRASITLGFLKPMTGLELAGIMQEIVAKHGSPTRLIMIRRYNDGDLLGIGMAERGYNDIRLVPSLDYPFFGCTEIVKELKIITHPWEEDSYKPRYSWGVRAVTEFAEELLRAYSDAVLNGFPVYVPSDEDAN
jgi:hypothetical protein